VWRRPRVNTYPAAARSAGRTRIARHPRARRAHAARTGISPDARSIAATIPRGGPMIDMIAA
jgi:hypothetical protein